MKTTQTPLQRLKHHVTGAIERGEKSAIVEQPISDNKTPEPDNQRNETRAVKRVSKFVNVWVCQGNYGSGWDDLTASPNCREVRDDIRDYNDNEPNPHRLIRRRITRENFEIGNY